MLAFALFIIISCNSKKRNNDDRIIAEVADLKLYASDIKISGNIKGKDSIDAAKRIIDEWVKSKLIYEYAKSNIINEDEIEDAVQNFREDYTKLAFEQELIHKNLDTVISHADLETYYNNNIETFKLKYPIVKLQLVVLDKSVPSDSLEFYLKNSDDKDTEEQLQEFCGSKALVCMLDNKNWQNANDITSKFPFLDNKLNDLKKSGKLYKTSDSKNNIIYVKVTDYIGKDNAQPMEFARPTISKILLSKRSQTIVQQKINAIYQEQLEKNKHKIY